MKSISTDRENSGDTSWWFEGLVCGENFASAHGKLTQDYSRTLLEVIRSFSWCPIDCPRTRDHALMERERGLQRCRTSLLLHSNLSRYHHISFLKPSLRLSTMILMWMLSQRAPIWNDISFKCVCGSRTLGAKYWLAKTEKLLDAAELNPLLSATGVEYIHRSISLVSVSFNRSSMKKVSKDRMKSWIKEHWLGDAQVWISIDNDGCVQWQEARAGIVTRRRNDLPGRASCQTNEKDEQKGEALDRYWDNRYGLVPTDQWRDRSPCRTVSPSSCSLRGRKQSERRDRRCRRTSSAVIWIEMNPRMTSTLCRSQSERQCRWTRRKVWHVSWWRWRRRAMKKSKSIQWSASFDQSSRPMFRRSRCPMIGSLNINTGLEMLKTASSLFHWSITRCWSWAKDRKWPKTLLLTWGVRCIKQSQCNAAQAFDTDHSMAIVLVSLSVGGRRCLSRLSLVFGRVRYCFLEEQQQGRWDLMQKADHDPLRFVCCSDEKQQRILLELVLIKFDLQYICVPAVENFDWSLSFTSWLSTGGH